MQREKALHEAHADEEAAVEAARGAAKQRNLRVGRPLWRDIVRTGVRPRVETRNGLRVLVTPVVLLYPVSGQSDLIEDVSEMDPLERQLAQCLPATAVAAQAFEAGVAASGTSAPASGAGDGDSAGSGRAGDAASTGGFLPWDRERKYTLDNVDVFYQANATKPLPLDTAWRRASDPLHSDAKPEPVWKGQSWVKVPLDAPLLLSLVQSDCVLTDVPVFYVVARGTGMHSKVLEEAGSMLRTLQMPKITGGGGQ